MIKTNIEQNLKKKTQSNTAEMIIDRAKCVSDISLEMCKQMKNTCAFGRIHDRTKIAISTGEGRSFLPIRQLRDQNDSVRQRAMIPKRETLKTFNTVCVYTAV